MLNALLVSCFAEFDNLRLRRAIGRLAPLSKTEFSMPFPLGHTAIGLAAFETVQKSEIRTSRWSLFVWVMLLANLPDVDVIIGLLCQGNGNIFHRGPTHSLVFALASGLLASQAWRVDHRIPRLGVGVCFILVLSHLVSDLLLTSGPVSIFWPLEVHWSTGHNGWLNIFHLVIFQGLQDIGIVAGAGVYLCAVRLWRRAPLAFGLLMPVRRR